jgi:hypothetical protein
VDSERGPAAKAVTGITKAASAVVTCVGHGYVVGNRIYFNGHTGMTQINGLYGTVTAVGGVNSFTVDIDSSAFGVWTAGGTAQLTYREIKYINLYRTVVSSQGVATYYYVTQVAVTATSYADTIASSVVSLNLPLSSQDYNAPTTLDGFDEMPNGIIIGWYKNQVYFCEPYKPHAWPAAYQAAVAFNIVGVGVVGQSAVICTEGIPYMCTGTHPSNMSITKIGAVAYPCAAQNSILSLPDGVYYASYQGIVSVGTGVPNVITAKLMNLENWTSLVAANKVNAAVYNNCYLGYSGYTSGAFEPTAFDNTAFVMDDLPDARAGFVIDFTDARVALNKVKFDYTKVANVQRDMWTTETFAIMNSRVYQMSLASTEDEGGYVWQSKDFRMDQPTNLSIGRIFWEQPPNITKPVTGTLKVYADGILVLSRSMPDNGAEFRLPSGRLYNFYSFRIEGNYRIHQFQFATSAKELRGM